MNSSAKHWISKLELKPHPEGGYYREIYRAQGIIAQASLPMRYNAGRSFATTIYYLLESSDFSSLHRLKSDEQWFHIDGSALTIHSIDPKGNYTPHHIGKNLDNGELPHAVIQHGNWFGGTADEANSFALVGCFVAPGFDFEDFELAQRNTLTTLFPQHARLIEQLTRQ